ncbi:hypothetical protein [Bacillus sp. JCM 19041]
MTKHEMEQIVTDILKEDYDVTIEEGGFEAMDQTICSSCQYIV